MNNSAWLTFLFLALLLNACGVYSFTGASIAPDIKTISIQSFFNESNGGPPNLTQDFNETIKDYFQQNTNLILVSEDGDLQIEGSIANYDQKPVAPTAATDSRTVGTSGVQRLTISIKATYVNVKDETFNFENKTFSFYDDYNPQRETFSSVENQLIETIFDQIVLDIFNASIANW